ncbi:E3 ubiquitin-protein ligase Topors-like, partial [Branchiostoma lanceolatum]|uniref:E3 ubiquitin-protein ligase Topors-like n=1 Tax=Branchiostoma lanceolatum TaxID=7740 RepID=UPI00345362FF
CISHSSDEGSSRVQKPAPASQSPDHNCSICLQQFQNKAFTDNCFHSFCYACIKEWSKVKATCPLCKTDFQSIIHTVKSIDDYQQDYLLPLGNGAFGTIDGQRFRYRTTLNLGRRMITESRRRIDEQMAIFHSYARHETIHCGRYRPERRMSAISIRKRVYSRGLRARGVQGDEGRTRDISAQFYRSNPAVTHRLVPWLSRELEALVASRDIVDFLLQLIVTVIQQVDLGSSTIKHTLEPYLLHRTDHFLHEFMTFAKYPFDMAAFDRNVIYESPIFGDVSPISPPHTPNLDRLTPPELHNIGPTPYVPSASGIADIPTSYMNWAPRHSTWDSPSVTPRTRPGRSVTSTSGWDDETPGPSGLNPDLETTVPPPPPTTATVKTEPEPEEVSQPRPVKTEQSPVHSPAYSSSGDSVVFTGYIKPLAERTPDAFISLSSESEDEASQDKDTTLQDNKNTKASPRRRYRSRSRNRRSRSRSRSREGRYKNLSRRNRSRSRTRRSRSSSSGRGHVRSRSRPRDRSKGRHQRSRSRSRRRSYSRSPSISWSRNREKERLLSKPGGKRKQKTRHLESSPASSYRASHRENTTSSQRSSSHSTYQPAASRSKDMGHERRDQTRSHRSRSRERSCRSTSKDKSNRSKVKERSHRSRSKDRSPVSRERDRHQYRGHSHRSRSSDRAQISYQKSPHSGDGQSSLVRYSGTYKNQGRTRRRSRSSSLEVTYEGKKKHDKYEYQKYSYSHRKHDNDSEVEVTFCKMSSKESRTSKHHHHHKSKKKHKHRKKSKKHKKSKDREKNTAKKTGDVSSTDEESSVGDVECLSTISVSEKGDGVDTTEEGQDQTVPVVIDQTQDTGDSNINKAQDSQKVQHRQEGNNGNQDNVPCELRHGDEKDSSCAGKNSLSRTEVNLSEEHTVTGALDSQTNSRHTSVGLGSIGSANVSDSGKDGPCTDSFLRKNDDKSPVCQSERRVISRSPEQEVMSQEGMMEQEVTSPEGMLPQGVDETVESTSSGSHRRIVLALKCQDERRIVISRNGGEGS